MDQEGVPLAFLTPFWDALTVDITTVKGFLSLPLAMHLYPGLASLPRACISTPGKPSDAFMVANNLLLKEVFVDAMYKTNPHPYEQYGLFCDKDLITFPVAYLLLETKTVLAV
jgi:hypothetical protein